MSYFKKISVLKQVENGFNLGAKEVSCILRIECESGVATAFLSAINLKAISNGEYFLYIADQKNKLHYFLLDKRPSSFTANFVKFPDIERGFSAGLVYANSGVPCVVAFGCEKPDKNSLSNFRKLVAESFLEKNLQSAPVCDAPPTAPIQEIYEVYNDEAVATENYYELDQSIDKKLLEIGERCDELLRNEDVYPNSGSQEKEREEQTQANISQDETDLNSCQKYNQENPFYTAQKRELDQLFDNFPDIDDLKSILPDSKWVKITYDKDKYYVVGTVSENDKVKYICYGVPSNYSENPPRELSGYASFIPLSIFDLKGRGYFMMFQDAITGKCVSADKDFKIN